MNIGTHPIIANPASTIRFGFALLTIPASMGHASIKNIRLVRSAGVSSPPKVRNKIKVNPNKQNLLQFYTARQIFL